MKRITQLVVGLLVLSLMAGCTTTALTTQQVENLSYMSGYSTVAIYLVAKKPEAPKVESFEREILMVMSALSTNPTSTSASANVSTLIQSFIAQTPTDSDTAILLQTMLPPVVVGIQAIISDYVDAQPASDQLKTIQAAAVCALSGMSDACESYLLAITRQTEPVIPPPLPRPIVPVLPVSALTYFLSPPRGQPIPVFDSPVAFTPIPLYWRMVR